MLRRQYDVFLSDTEEDVGGDDASRQVSKQLRSELRKIPVETREFLGVLDAMFLWLESIRLRSYSFALNDIILFASFRLLMS